MYKLTERFKSITNIDWKDLLSRPHFKLIAWSAVSLIAVCILFALPILTVAIETVAPYQVTEVNNQPYTTTEYYAQQSPVEKSIVISDGYYTVVPSGIIIPFSVDKSGARLTGTFINTIPGSFVIYNSANRIFWEDLGNAGTIDIPLQPGHYKAKFQENIMWGEDVYIQLRLVWNEVESYTASKEITKYQQVPVTVEKQGKQIREDRMSIWQLIFEREYPSV
jgi:hypothetical protein